MNNPQLRFKNDIDEWETFELGNIGSTYNGLNGKSKTDFGHGEAKYITYMNVYKNTISNPKIVDSIEIDNTQNKVVYGDILFTTSSETPEEVGMSSVWISNEDNIYLNSFCFGYRPTKELNPIFMGYLLRANSFRKQMMLLAQGISRYNISKTKTMKITIELPSLEIQSQIATLLSDIDTKIAAQEQRVEKLKIFKNAMLEKMFPKEGQTVPEIRFAGFTDDWEQRKLGEKCVITMGQSPDGSTYSEVPSDYILVQGNADLKDGWVNPRMWTTQKTKTAQAGDLIMSVRAPAGAMGKTAFDAVIGRGVAAIKGNEYIYQLLVKMDSEGYWKSLSCGSTFESLNSQNILNAEITIPDIEEQKLIGEYFQNLDNLITLHQRKLDKLKEFKKALLNKILP